MENLKLTFHIPVIALIFLLRLTSAGLIKHYASENEDQNSQTKSKTLSNFITNGYKLIVEYEPKNEYNNSVLFALRQSFSKQLGVPASDIKLVPTSVDDQNKGNNFAVIDVIKNSLSSSWELPFIIACSAAILLTFIIMLAVLTVRRNTKKFDLELTTPKQLVQVSSAPRTVESNTKHIVYQPVVKPRLRQADLVQPIQTEDFPQRQQLNIIPSYAVRLKAKGLLERRGSNASLTLDLNHGSESSSSCSVSARESNVEEYLLSAGNRMTVRELRNCLNDTRLLHSEFWEIPMNHQEKVGIPGSGTKNRYKTILPNEKTRVKLPQLHNDALSTYINANYIRGYDGEAQAYIATQGPMSHTLSDFWSMVWFEKVPIIVMITKYKENGKAKCEQYIPDDNSSCTYGDITVTITLITPKDGYTIRELELRHGRETREVLHFWYTAWPDHKTPSTGQQLLMMATQVETCRRKLLNVHHPTNVRVSEEDEPKCPVLVHCSAGIGRTGCFIAVSIGMQQLLEENMVDILGIICQMRCDRGGMVQTSEQYVFVHQMLCIFEQSLQNRPDD